MRKRVPYENPQGRRYNLLALYVPDGPQAALDWSGAGRHLSSADLVDFLRSRPASAVPLVVVLDNAGLHKSKVVRAALPELWARRIYLYYLPPYSPELNAIERVFRSIKHHRLPERSYATLQALESAISDAFSSYHTALRCLHQPRIAA
jgi:transposase